MHISRKLTFRTYIPKGIEAVHLELFDLCISKGCLVHTNLVPSHIVILLYLFGYVSLFLTFCLYFLPSSNYFHLLMSRTIWSSHFDFGLSLGLITFGFHFVIFLITACSLFLFICSYHFILCVFITHTIFSSASISRISWFINLLARSLFRVLL